MNAGRTLDALVEERVMGIVWDEARCRVCGWLFRRGGCLPNDCSMRPLPAIHADTPAPCSTDIGAAWLVVERLVGERGWFFDLGNKPSDPGDMEHNFVWNAFFRRTVVGPDAATPMLAICLSALAAVGYAEPR